MRSLIKSRLSNEVKKLHFAVPAIILAGAVIFLVLAGSNGSGTASCRGEYRNDEQVRVGSYHFQVEAALSKYEQQKGLSGRECIGLNQGMLFRFEKPGYYSFWMKDMHFPIDIIWISADREVVGLEHNVEPSTYPDGFINKDQPAKYVLELKAGRAKSLGLGLGSRIDF